MKRTLIGLLSLFYITTLVSCDLTQKGYVNRLYNTTMEKVSNICEFSTIIVIPETGCSGCISEAGRFFKGNYHNNKILFVFTNFYSEKALKLKFGADLFGSENICIDSDNAFYIPESSNNIYPFVLQLHDGALLKGFPFSEWENRASKQIN